MIGLIVGVLIIAAWLTFYVSAAIAIFNLLGVAACIAFISFFVGFVLTKVATEYTDG